MSTNLPATAERSAPMRVSGRLKRALDAMVWEGLSRAGAAETAGIREHSLYCALKKPHVLSYYLNEIGVLRSSERAKNIHTLAAVRDQTENQMARVAAVKALEPPAAQAQVNVNIAFQAGYVIDLREPEDIEAGRPLTIEHVAVP
jgi:hypothetical protein